MGRTYGCGAARVVRRLVHLGRYYSVLQLDNAAPSSSLVDKLHVELLRAPPDFDPSQEPDPRPFDTPGLVPELDVGDWAFLRIRNESEQVLNIAVLDLQPDWGICQVFPAWEDTSFWPFDPGEEKYLPLQANLPEGLTAGLRSAYRETDWAVSRQGTVAAADVKVGGQTILTAATSCSPRDRSRMPSACAP